MRMTPVTKATFYASLLCVGIGIGFVFNQTWGLSTMMFAISTGLLLGGVLLRKF